MIVVGTAAALLLGALTLSPHVVRAAESDPAPAPAPLTRRAPPAGEIVGIETATGAHAWLGVPYAAPPTGALRWHAPRPAPRFEETLEATALGAPCSQFAHPFGGISDHPRGTLVGSEDCLTLNIWAPRFEPGDVPTGGRQLPVLFWIHGGGNTIGHAGFYDGGHLAATQDVIVVIAQYRLGPFGWFRNAALRAGEGSEADRSGNYGTLDLIRGLTWVRDNIADFGGDPHNVTIFGESAGGRNVVTLLLSKLATGLFHRAVVQSGGTGTRTVAEAENWNDDAEPGAEGSSNEILARLRVADGGAADTATARAQIASMSAEEIASYLRGKSTGEFLSVYRREDQEGLIDIPRVFRDGTVLPDGDTLELFAAGDYNRVPTILGTNHDENKLFLYANPIFVRQWFGVFPQVFDWNRFETSAEYLSKNWKATGADAPAAVMRPVQGPSVYVYRFDWDEEPTSYLLFDLARVFGASHGFEIPFVFGHWQIGPSTDKIFTRGNEPGRLALSEQMMSYWTEFARSGAPGRGRDGTLPEWLAWDPAPDGHKTLILDTPAGGGARMGSAPVTVESVLAEIAADPRLETQRERCFVYRQIAKWDEDLGFGPEEYLDAGPTGCREWPYDEWPW
ncbi:MAG: carboxylesterase/lipase family protein [Myxococcota bacterium]